MALLNLRTAEQVTLFQSYKGVFYVIVTSLLLFLLLRRSTGKLALSEMLHKSYFEQNPNPMWLVDTQTQKFIAVNQAAVNHYGYSREEFLAMSAADIRPKEDIELYNAIIKSSAPTGVDSGGPYRHVKKNGEIIFVNISAQQTSFQGKKAAFILSVNVTQRVQQEQEILKANQTLEQKVDERTRLYHEKNYELELANHELTSLNEELKAANDKLTEANNLIAQQAAMLVKQSEAKLNQIVNTIQDVVWSASLQNRELNFINRAAEQVFGYPTTELYANSRILINIVWEEDKLLVQKAFQKLLADGYAEVEYRIQHLSGSRRWVKNRVWLTRDANGVATIMHGVVSDITEKKKTEAELIKRENLLSSLIDSQTNYLIRTDLEGRYTFVNQQFLIKFQFTQEEVIGNFYAHTIVKEDLEKCQAMAIECIRHPGKIVPLQIRKPDKSGEVFWTEWEFVGIQDEKGYVAEIQGVGQDITQRKKAEEALKESTQALKEAQQVARIGNWGYDIATQHIHWSEQVFTIHGLDKEKGEPSLQQLFTLYYSEDLPVVQSAIARTIQEAIPYNLDIRIVKPLTKQVIYVNIIGKPVLDANGKVVKMHGTMMDINDRKLVEKNLQEQNEQLKKINAEMDRFVYSVSHNLRAPLTSVLGLINIIRLGEVDAQLNQYLGLMERSINKLDETIHEINNYSRNARLGLSIAKIDLQILIQETVDVHKFIAGAERIRIETVFETNQPFFSDAERLRVVMNNLLSNAIKYHDDTKENSYVNIQAITTKTEAIIEVSDNGIGIDNKLTDKIFTMFFRASERSTGSGLGLYIVKEAVEKLQGRITVESQLGQGTTFVVQVPNSHE